MKRTTAALTATVAAAAIAAPAALLAAAPAHADVDRHGSIGAGVYELSVDREDGGFEVGFDVDRVAPGSTWRVVLRHDGRRVLARTLVADHEGELDVEVRRPDTAGTDTFRVRAHRVGGTARAADAITVR